MPTSSAQSHDRLRAAHREQRGDGVGVVAAHHAERAPGVAAAERGALEQDDAPGAAQAEVVRDRGSEEAAADHDDVCALAHGGGVSRLAAATVRHPPSGRREAMVPSPRDDALSVPSRTVEHARTFVSWPCRADLWGGHLAEAEAEYAAVVEAIARFEPVTVIAQPGTTPRLPADTAHPVDVAEIPIDDSWVRDNGPIFVVDGRGGVAAVRLRVQRLGRQVRAVRRRRAAAGAAGAVARRCALYEAPLVAEGGGLTFDGEGTRDHDRVRPAQPEPQSRASRASASRRCCATTSGSRR